MGRVRLAGEPPLAVIRADASARIGGGHVVRCLALAEELNSRGWTVAFCATTETFEVVPEALAFPSSAAIHQASATDPDRVRRQWPEGASLLVIDHYGLDASFEAALRTFAGVVLVIDDFPTRQHVGDILVDTTLGRETYDYADLGCSTALCGADYALLRSPFRKLRGAHRYGTGRQHHEWRAVVSLGLTDALDATGFVLNAISGLLQNVDVILGEGAPHRERIAVTVAGMVGWRFHRQLSAAAMADLLAQADFVIGAAGSSSYERCCLGKPSFLLQTATNQSGNIAALTEAGVAFSLGTFAEVSLNSVRRNLATRLKNRDAILRTGERASNLVDGNGVVRVADAVEAALSAV